MLNIKTIKLNYNLYFVEFCRNFTLLCRIMDRNGFTEILVNGIVIFVKKSNLYLTFNQFNKDSIVKLQMTAFDLSKKVLKLNGYFLCKLWFGDRIELIKKDLLKNFDKVKIIKPPASRSDSAEIFLFCSNFKI